MSTEVSELQKEKLIHMFGLLDIDGNGVIEYDDFRMVVDVMCDERGWSRGHRRRLGLVRANKRLWNMMAGKLDADGDGEITLAEGAPTRCACVHEKLSLSPRVLVRFSLGHILTMGPTLALYSESGSIAAGRKGY
mgnify:CR=1 FL=1